MYLGNAQSGENLWKSQENINHLMYVDDVKVLANN